MKKITCAVLTVLSTCAFIKVTYADDGGFDFDDLDAVEAVEQQTLLQMAQEAAKNYDFDTAQSLIEQAENKAYAPDDIESAKQVLANAKAKKQREDAEKARIANAKRQQQNQSHSSASTSSSASSSAKQVPYVNVKADCTSGWGCMVKKLHLSGGPNFSSISNNQVDATITSSKSLAGNYRYSIAIDNNQGTVCSGSVYIDGTKQWVTINVYAKGCNANVYSN